MKCSAVKCITIILPGAQHQPSQLQIPERRGAKPNAQYLITLTINPSQTHRPLHLCRTPHHDRRLNPAAELIFFPRDIDPQEHVPTATTRADVTKWKRMLGAPQASKGGGVSIDASLGRSADYVGTSFTFKHVANDIQLPRYLTSRWSPWRRSSYLSCMLFGLPKVSRCASRTAQNIRYARALGRRYMGYSSCLKACRIKSREVYSTVCTCNEENPSSQASSLSNFNAHLARATYNRYNSSAARHQITPPSPAPRRIQTRSCATRAPCNTVPSRAHTPNPPGKTYSAHTHSRPPSRSRP